MNSKSVIQSVFSRGLSVLLLILVCISCSLVYTDQAECPSGVSLQFVYDYNMEYADAFHSKAHCARVYVFDAGGAHVGTFEEQGDALKDESWRMNLELPEGEYTLIAYSGLSCEESSFTSSLPTRSSLFDLSVALDHEGAVSDKALHDLYYGTQNVTVDSYRNHQEVKIHLKKNTNNIRVILQQEDDADIAPEDFTFTITDDNSLLDADNNVVPAGDLTYMPWAKGKVAMGVDTSTGLVSSAAYAEFSTSRLVKENSPRLVIRSISQDREIVNIPLIDYLLLMRSDRHSDMPAQEFLDRESEWSILFVSKNDRWFDITIFVNGWRVNINDANF